MAVNGMSSQFIGDELDKVAKRCPGQTALQMRWGSHITRYTYGDIQRLSLNLGRSLHKRGIQKGDCAAICIPTSPEWAIIYLALLYSGVIVVSLDLEFSASELFSALLETGAKAVFTTAAKSKESLEGPLKGLPSILTVTLDDELQPDGGLPLRQLLNEVDSPFSFPSISGEDVATIVYTSGTTGTPKGVVLSHLSVTTTILGMSQYLDLKPGDNVLAVVPSHHVFAPIGSLLVPLVAGITITYLAGVKSTDLVAAFHQERITVFPCVPQIFYLFHKKIFDEVRQKPLIVRMIFDSLRRLSYGLRRFAGVNCGRFFFSRVHKAFGGSLRLLISGGSYFDPRIVRDLYSLGFSVKQGYGLTESFGGGTLSPSRNDIPGSVGISLPGVEVRIFDPDENGIGEVVIGGPTLMRGYLNDPVLTSEILHDGWLFTGDLGRKDGRGHLFITGRKKDVIVLSSGKKIFPEELEERYLQSPVMKEICVFGNSSCTGTVQGEQLHAIVVPDFDYLREVNVVNSRQIIREEIERISASLPEHKRILSYNIQSTPLPRTATRKIMRWVIVESFRPQEKGSQFWQNPSHDADADWGLPLTETFREVLQIVGRECRLEAPCHPDMNLELDLGFDSLQRIELFATLEHSFGVHFANEAAARCFTLKDVIGEVERSLNGNSGRPQAIDDAQISWADILQSAPNDSVAESYILKQRPFLVLLNFLLLKIVFALAKILFRLEIRGRENLPEDGPYLICPNHESYLDGVLVACVLPYSVIRKLFTLGWSEFFTGSWFKEALASMIGTVPINPDTKLLSAMKVSAVGLRAGKVLLMFPEGGLTMNGELQIFHKGPAILSRELQAPIVPVAIHGAFHVWPKGSNRIRLRPIKLSISEPVFPPLLDRGPGKDYDAMIQGVKDQISDMLKMAYNNAP